jgi:hypothetical protein
MYDLRLSLLQVGFLLSTITHSFNNLRRGNSGGSEILIDLLSNVGAMCVSVRGQRPLLGRISGERTL